MKLLPVHSTCVVTSTFVVDALAHVMHVRVFTANAPPLGTSGVRVVVSIVIPLALVSAALSVLGLSTNIFFVDGTPKPFHHTPHKREHLPAGSR